MTGKLVNILKDRKALFSLFLYLALLVGSGIYWSLDLQKNDTAGISKERSRITTGAARKILDKTIDTKGKGYTVEKGATFSGLLKENGVPKEEALFINNKTKSIFDFFRIPPGNEIRFDYPLDNQDLIKIDHEISDLEYLEIEVADDRITALRIEKDEE